MILPTIGRLSTGEEVIDRPMSHTHEGVTAELLREALAKIKLGGEQFAKFTVDMGRIVGESTCVLTTEVDQIVFAKRPKRFGLSRFVKDRQPEPCSSIVVILKKAEEQPSTYVLIAAFIGEGAEPEPWDRNSTPAAREFWRKRALIWGSEETIPGTETTETPVEFR